MSSAARMAANQANAAHSTGPRTDAGKARSSRNALKHGLTSADLIVRPEEQEEFDLLLASLVKEVEPVDTLEEIAFQNLVVAAWNLRRCRRAEAELAASGSIESLLDNETALKLERLNRYAAHNQRLYDKAFKQLEKLHTIRAERISLNPEKAMVTYIPRLADQRHVAKSIPKVDPDTLYMAQLNAELVSLRAETSDPMDEQFRAGNDQL